MSHEHTHIHTTTTNHSPHYQPLETWNGKRKIFLRQLARNSFQTKSLQTLTYLIQIFHNNNQIERKKKELIKTVQNQHRYIKKLAINYPILLAMTHLIEDININGIDYTIVITFNSKAHSKAPMSIYINQQGNQEMGDYIYTISSYSTYLNNLTNNDQIKLLNQLLVKKFNVPIFLNISGDIGTNSNVELFRSIVDLVEHLKLN